MISSPTRLVFSITQLLGYVRILIWAMDFFTVATADFRFLNVFVVMHHGRRRVLHFAMTYNPSMEWVIQLPSNRLIRKKHPTKLV